MNRLRCLLTGMILGVLGAVVLTIVPLYGVRKSIEKLFLNWQEVVFVISTIFSGALIGLSIARSKLNLLEDDRVSKVKVSVAEVEDPGSFKPKVKRKWLIFSGVRSKLLFSCLYLLLYINLSILCVYFRLGIVDIAGLNILLRSTGAFVSMIGLFFIIKGVRFAKTIPVFFESSYYDSEIGLLEDFQCGENTSSSVSHIPPVSLRFFSSHPILKGWFLYIVGIPLVFQAWFPLLALPGVFVGLNWMYQKARK